MLYIYKLSSSPQPAIEIPGEFLMVSLPGAIPSEKKRCHKVENFFSKKRKKGDEEESQGLFPKKMKVEKEEEIELSLNVPLPLDWQRCLDIKSGQIHFYNTRTQRRTSTDPRLILDPSPPPASTLSLDLELNLASRDSAPRPKSQRDSKGPSLSWTSPDADADAGEMVAAVCARCHMLVMMSKPALSCPNCKFVNPPDHSFSTAIKPAVKILCCKY